MAYENYKGRCIGRLLAFLYRLDYNFDTALFDEKSATMHGELVVTWEWEEGTDVPIFTFHNKLAHLNDDPEYVKVQLERILRINPANKICKCNRGYPVEKSGMCTHCESRKRFQEMLEKFKNWEE